MARNQQESTREGGREGSGAALPPDLSGSNYVAPANRSGAASTAASLLDLRQKVNYILEEMLNIFELLGDAQAVARVKAYRQTGFRSGR